MKVLKFKTNIVDNNELARLAPFLDKEEKISKWRFDSKDEDKVLFVSGEEITPDIVTSLLHQSGFHSKLIHIVAVGGHDL